MTTNVFDGVGGVVAADTRWSIQYGSYLYFLDEPLYPKIEVLRDRFVMVFAGMGEAIQRWKDWVRSAPRDFTARPGTKGMAVCIIDLQTGRSIFKERQAIKLDDIDVCMAGSGASHAFPCWSANGCAKKAVATASGLDLATGGDVHFYEIASRNHNLQPVAGAMDLRIEQVSRNISERGMVMKTNNNNAAINVGAAPFPIKEFAAANEEAADIRDKLANGQIFPDAPCASMYTEWSAEEERKLNEALATVFDIK